VIKATRYDMAVISANRHHDRVMAMVSSPKWALLSVCLELSITSAMFLLLVAQNRVAACTALLKNVNIHRSIAVVVRAHVFGVCKTGKEKTPQENGKYAGAHDVDTGEA
jgi:hypothetical protein